MSVPVLSAETLLKRFEELKQIRGPWEKHWEEIRTYVLPRYLDVVQGQGRAGQKHTGKVFDSTASLALERFAAVLDSLLTPRTQLWHGLKASSAALNQLPEVKAWFEAVVAQLFQFRYQASANFASQQQEVYLSLGAFGTAVLSVEEASGGALCYRHIPITSVYLAENHEGNIDTLFRTFSLTARQAKIQWPQERLPEVIERAALEQPERLFSFVHAVFPEAGHIPGKRGFMSAYVCMDSKTILATGTYRVFPYVVSRYVTTQGEVYGRSPAMAVLPDIKLLNEMERTQLHAVHHQVRPPLLVPDDGTLRTITLAPGAINYGGISPSGSPLIQPMAIGGRLELNEAKMEQKRRVIQDAFLVTLFQILVDSPAMTATEVLQRAQEKALLLAPIVGRQQTESLGPLIERELDILAEQHALPPLPEILLHTQANFDIHYDSPINHLQKAYQGQGILRMLEGLAPFIAIDPSVLDIFDVHEIAVQMADMYGVPQSMLRSTETFAILQAQRAQATMLEDVVEKAPTVIETITKLATASLSPSVNG